MGTMGTVQWVQWVQYSGYSCGWGRVSTYTVCVQYMDSTVEGPAKWSGRMSEGERTQ